MNKSYLSNFLKIFFWQGSSILLGMVSMLVVVPALTSSPTIYGIYMLCMSFNIFLNYADIGFINAGFKFAAEHFSRGNLKDELRIVGFVGFVLAVFLIIPFILFLIASIKPDLIIGGLTNDSDREIASHLLLIQGIFSFNIILNKVGVIAYGIRLENHKINQISIIASLIKISSIFYFFNDTKYDIVGYFLFGKIVETASYVLIVYLTKIRFNYDILYIIKSFRFSKKIFNETKDLAIVTFIGSLLWIIYYELDSVVITKFLGAEIFAFFAVSLTLTKFIRSLFSVIFGPFNARFNHLVGLNQLSALNDYFVRTLKSVFPALFLFILSIVAYRKAIIMSWVGPDYSVSVPVLLFLASAMLFNAIRCLSVSVATALLKTRLLLYINLGMAVGYWLFILLTVHNFGLLSFAYSKFLIFILADLIFLFVLCRMVQINFIKLISELFLPLIIPSMLIMVVSKFYLSVFSFYLIKSKVSLLLVLLSVMITYLISITVLYLTSSDLRVLINKIVKQVALGFQKPVTIVR